MQQLSEFFPLPTTFFGGVRVAAVDRNGDGRDDVVAGAGPGGSPDVSITDGLTKQRLDDFFGFDPNFTGGMYVASGR